MSCCPEHAPATRHGGDARCAMAGQGSQSRGGQSRPYGVPAFLTTERRRVRCVQARQALQGPRGPRALLASRSQERPARLGRPARLARCAPRSLSARRGRQIGRPPHAFAARLWSQDIRSGQAPHVAVAPPLWDGAARPYALHSADADRLRERAGGRHGRHRRNRLHGADGGNRAIVLSRACARDRPAPTRPMNECQAISLLPFHVHHCCLCKLAACFDSSGGLYRPPYHAVHASDQG